jgi:hypothetical protein
MRHVVQDTKQTNFDSSGNFALGHYNIFFTMGSSTLTQAVVVVIFISYYITNTVLFSAFSIENCFLVIHCRFWLALHQRY